MYSTVIENEEILYTHDIYSGEISELKAKKKLIPYKKNGAVCRTFSRPVTSNHLAKIYIIENRSGNIVYVGKTMQPLSTRLRAGLNPIHETGYHGYHWQDKELVSIHCFCIQRFDDKEIESTEAEIVYLFRRNTNKWPEYQSEIHFSNSDKGKIMAEVLYNQLGINLTIASS